MKKALIFGVTGQDGSYLSEILLEKGYEVHGVKRRSSSYNTSRVDHIYSNKNFKMHYGDVTDSLNVTRLIQTIKPDEIYNLAAQSHVMVSFEIPEYTGNVDALGTLRILESIRLLGMEDKVKFYQASTSELYGLVQEVPQKETTPFYPRSPYGCAKLAGFWYVKNYREAYNIFACNGILFNHETIAGFMPMIFKEGKEGDIDIKPISEVVRYHTNKGKCSINESLDIYQESEVTNELYVWDSNWTRVKFSSGYPHKKDKNPKFVVSKNAAYMATGNHVCIMEDKKEKEFKDISVGDLVNLVEYPTQDSVEYNISINESKLIGYIIGDGTKHNNKPRLIGKNKSLLEKYASIWESIGGTVTSYLAKSGFTGEKDIWHYNLNGNKEWVEKYLSDMYNEDKTKRIPKIILNSSSEIMYNFLLGYNEADGLKKNKCNYLFKNFKTNSAVLAAGLLFCLNKTTNQQYNINVEYGYAHNKYNLYYSINVLSPKDSINKYNVVKSKLDQNLSGREIHKQTGISRTFIYKIKNGYIPNSHCLSKSNNMVKKIIDLPSYDGWFYDLETESGTFHCGIGQGHVHNSPRRGETFVTQKIVMGLNSIKKGVSDYLYLGNLNALRDWSHAKDMCYGMWLMLQQDTPDDYVLSCGKQYSVRQFVESCAPYFGMDIVWKGEGLDEVGIDTYTGNTVIRVDTKYFRPTEVATLLGDSTKARTVLGWKPQYNFDDLVEEMCEYELQR